ncbi:hypothetical protein K435DRAFT_772398 [Dendrothele bispora CBS 962.96]|uniref:RING-type domain-containing protein n=1 Tax=Dendrothele bispora (strain CBS 962.96) TaxID=1314807 RepID=A0A4S8MWC6_DENBC|nr:hypothetical protein K435DRAFT_772398 [Dendrothele bispora CBS 962.96]
MSTREPMWYCHECSAEMRPLMVPDPVCASCRGTFVEKIENDDDPREFHRGEPGLDDAGGVDPFFLLFQGLMDRGISSRRPSSPRPNAGSGFSVQIRNGSNGPATISFGGPRTLGTGDGGGGVPTMSEYLRRRPDGGGDRQSPIAGPLMAHYLMALLGGRGPMGDVFGDAAQTGRMGDYVFNQEALDQIITQLMEQSNSSRPVPATEEIMQKLPKDVLEEGSPMLEKDCAVCKEQFKLGSEDPDEQVFVTLPCNHPFHEPCIIPWLKSSGTCPVCRHQLVPQPEHHTPPQRDSPTSSSQPSSPSQRRDSRPRSPGRESESGLLHSLFGFMPGHNNRENSRQNNRENRSSRHNRSNSNPENSSSSSRNDDHHVPGGWDELD